MSRKNVLVLLWHQLVSQTICSIHSWQAWCGMRPGSRDRTGLQPMRGCCFHSYELSSHAKMPSARPVRRIVWATVILTVSGCLLLLLRSSLEAAACPLHITAWAQLGQLVHFKLKTLDSSAAFAGKASIIPPQKARWLIAEPTEPVQSEWSKWRQRVRSSHSLSRLGVSASFQAARVDTCEPSYPRHWAPCVKVPDVDIVYAEELIYPAVKIRLPGFLTEKDRQTWLAWSHQRDLRPQNDGYVHMGPKHGQNFVIQNAHYRGYPGGSWTSQGDTCMAGLSTISQFKNETKDASATMSEEAFLSISPDSWSFQHFTDHVTKFLVQGMHLIGPNTDVYTSPRDSSVVREMYGWVPTINSSHLTTFTTPRFAKHLIFSCRSPYRQPYALQRFRELAVGVDAHAVPMSQRKVVLYCSRSRDSQRVQNGGRRVLNEGALLESIKELLAKRNQGEVLEVLDVNKFPSYRELVKYINSNVRAIIGPHGGALMNIIYTAKDTLMLEFQPDTRINWGYWEMAPMTHANYWLTIIASEGNSDMTVDITSVLQVLDRQLGHEEPLGFYVDREYDWPKALDGARRRH